MKKVFITMCAVLIASASFAAGYVDSVRYLTTRAGRNWFISVDGSLNWWKGSMVAPSNYTMSFTKMNKMDVGGSIVVGKWINHKVGVRLSYDVSRGHSYIYGRHDNLEYLHWLYDDRSNPVEGDVYATSFWNHNLHADFLFSPVDFFSGYYNPHRVYQPVLFVGGGLSMLSRGVFVSSSWASKDTKLNRVNYEFSFDAGLINNFRLSEYVDLHLDFDFSMARWNLDSWFYEFEGVYDGQALRPKRYDFNFSAGLGVTYYIRGRIYELPYNYEKEMREMNERIKNLEDELTNMPVPVPLPADTVVIYSDKIEAISYPFSIFFNLDSYQLMSGRDLVNLRELVTVAKANNWKLRLRGSCDSATATPEYNQKLAENRCRKIMMELIDLGFPEENIVLEPVGGVKELDPTEYDRRVLIDVVKYHED